MFINRSKARETKEKKVIAGSLEKRGCRPVGNVVECGGYRDGNVRVKRDEKHDGTVDTEP